ncbi:DNA polymerase III subunit delta' [Patescibacteria group bacterium]|nr:DNA polymerase III subunit delta' [Patescibacteria group bacterium]
MPKIDKKANFSDEFKWPIVGHKNILWYLQHSIVKGQLNHAYLFSGPKSIGKTKITECFVSSLLCRFEHQQNKSDHKNFPCNECVSCTQYQKGLHPDVYWVKIEENEKTGSDKKNISIAQIRELQSKLARRSFLNSYKVAVITNAEKMTTEAANSLLKTLEEPSPKTILILLTSDSTKLPQTIISRCQTLKFLPVSKSEITSYLHQKGIERKKASQLASLSLGRPGIALAMSEDESMYQQYVDEVTSFLKLQNINLASRFKEVSHIIPTGIGFIEQGKLLDYKLNIWNSIIRDLILIKKSSEQFLKNSYNLSELEKVAKQNSKDSLLQIQKNIAITRNYLTMNLNPKLAIENLLINL